MEGSQTGEKCPVGTYMPSTGSKTVEECRNCTKGFYCNDTGLTIVVGPCQQGYYCEEGQSDIAPSDSLCWKGKF